MKKNYRVLVDPSPLMFTVGYFNEKNSWISVEDFENLEDALEYIKTVESYEQ